MKNNIISRLIGLMLVLALVVGVCPMGNVNVEAADGSFTVTLGRAEFTPDGKFHFAEAKVKAPDTMQIHSVMVVISKGMMTAASTQEQGAIVDECYKSATWCWSTAKTASDVQSIIRSIAFDEKKEKYRNGSSYSERALTDNDPMQISITVSSGETNVPLDAKMTSYKMQETEENNVDEDDVEKYKTHYYMFCSVAEYYDADADDGSDGGVAGKFDWSDAYNLAKQFKFMGLQGYLVTITEAGEDATLDSITTAGAWGGGLRIKNEFLYDSNYDTDYSQFDTATAPSYANKCPGSNSDAYSNKETTWVWMCGPEAGHEIPNTDLSGKVPGHGVDWTDDSKYNVNYYVNHNTGNAKYDYKYMNWKSGEPNSCTDEWCLWIHYGTPSYQTELAQADGKTSTAVEGWNDYTNKENAAGFYVEFSDYPGGRTSSYKKGGIQTVTATISHQYTYTVEDNCKQKTIQVVAQTEDSTASADDNLYQPTKIDIDIVFDEDNAVAGNEDYVDIKMTRSEGDTDAPDPIVTVSYSGRDGTTYSPTPTKPTAAGKYRVTVTAEDDTSVFWDFEIKANPDSESHELICVPEYYYIYSGTGIDFNRGYIYYTQAQVDAATSAKDKEKFDPSKGYNFVKVDDIYGAREELHNVAQDSKGEANESIYIDMYTEHLNTPSKVVAYRLTATGKWEESELTDEKLQKAIDKGTTQISVTFTALKDGKPNGEVYTFKKIYKRDACTNVRVNYAECRDYTGRTNGQFILINQNNKPMYNLGATYDVTFACSDDAKKIATVGWGKWPSTGGVWVPDIPKNEDGTPGTKTVKYTLYIRKAAADKGSYYTPATKVKKVAVSSMLKPVTSIKADYKKETLKLKKDIVVYFGTTIPNVLTEDYKALTKNFGTYTYAVTKAAAEASQSAVSCESLDVSFVTLMKDYNAQAKFEDYGNLIIEFNKNIAENADLKKNGIDISKYLTETRNSYMIWQTATEKKPASVTKTYQFAKRGVVDSTIQSQIKIDETKFTVNMSKLGTAPNTFAVEVGVLGNNGKTSWKTTIPMVKKESLVTAGALDYKIAEEIYPIRVKLNAKGGKETDTSFANGKQSYVLVTYKNVSTNNSVKVGIASLQYFDTEDLAKAAKLIEVEAASGGAVN